MILHTGFVVWFRGAGEAHFIVLTDPVEEEEAESAPRAEEG